MDLSRSGKLTLLDKIDDKYKWRYKGPEMIRELQEYGAIDISQGKERPVLIIGTEMFVKNSDGTYNGYYIIKDQKSKNKKYIFESSFLGATRKMLEVISKIEESPHPLKYSSTHPYAGVPEKLETIEQALST